MKERIKKAAGRVWWLQQELEQAEAEYDALLLEAIEAGELKKSAVGRKVASYKITEAGWKTLRYMRTLEAPSSHDEIAKGVGLHPGTVRRFLYKAEEEKRVGRKGKNGWFALENEQ